MVSRVEIETAPLFCSSLLGGLKSFPLNLLPHLETLKFDMVTKLISLYLSGSPNYHEP